MATVFFQRRAGPNGPEKPQQPEQIFAACGRNIFLFFSFFLFSFFFFLLSFGFWLFAFGFWLLAFAGAGRPIKLFRRSRCGFFRAFITPKGIVIDRPARMDRARVVAHDGAYAP